VHRDQVFRGSDIGCLALLAYTSYVVVAADKSSNIFVSYAIVNYADF
jgi:hypothetical protein